MRPCPAAALLPLASPSLLRHASNALLVAALTLGVHTRWVSPPGADTTALVQLLVLLVAVIACALIIARRLRAAALGGGALGAGLVRVATGCLMGVVGLTPNYKQLGEEGLDEGSGRVGRSVWMGGSGEGGGASEADEGEWAMNVAFFASVGLRGVWVVVEAAFGAPALSGSKSKFKVIDPMDVMEVGGFALSPLLLGLPPVPPALLVLSLLLTLALLRLHAPLALPLLAFLLPYSALRFFPRLLGARLGVGAGTCLVGRVALGAVVEWRRGGGALEERWGGWLRMRPATQRLAVSTALAVQVWCVVVLASNISAHKEWYVVAPLFAALTCVWLGYHALLHLTAWALIRRLSHCNKALCAGGLLEGPGRSLSCVMAASGLRHFALVGRCVALAALAATLLLGVVAWETQTALGGGAWVAAIPLNVGAVGLLGALAGGLGGTCVGYALVVPSAPACGLGTPGGGVTLLSPLRVQTLAAHSTRVLDAVQRFFAFNLVESAGADYSCGGQSLVGLGAKLRLLFERMTSDGLRFDTYVLYYCGPVYDNGDWALCDGARLSLAALLSLWCLSHAHSGARLLLVLDTPSSHAWLEGVRRAPGVSLALQTFRPRPPHSWPRPSTPPLSEGSQSAFSSAGSLNPGQLKNLEAVGKARGDTSNDTSFSVTIPSAVFSSSSGKAGPEKFVAIDLKTENFDAIMRPFDGKKSAIVDDTEELGSSDHCMEELGSFTLDWVEYGCSEGCFTWSERQSSKLRWRYGGADYAVSPAWTDFHHPPLSAEAVRRYWATHYPAPALACVAMLWHGGWGGGAGGGVWGGCVDHVVRCVRRKRMRWMPPTECDVGNGVRLVRDVVAW